MEDKRATDYEPGELPVPLGSLVWYESNGFEAGVYVIIERVDPINHPLISKASTDELEGVYPDGAAYHLWPTWIRRKFGNRHHAPLWVRRTSFSVEERADG